MKWEKKVQDDFQWHKWYAWHPVVVQEYSDGSSFIIRRAWLETVYRRRQADRGGSHWVYNDKL